MSISNTVRKTSVMQGDGSSVLFPFSFRINDEDDLLVYVKKGDNDYQEQILNENYELINLVRDNNNFIISGDIKYPKTNPNELVQPEPLTTNDYIYAIRKTPETQLESSEQISFKSKDIERALDKLTMLVQELQEQIDRSYKAPEYQSAIDEADFYTVAQNIDNVNTVAGIVADIDLVNSNATNITTVAQSISDVNAVGQSISNVNAVADDLTNIDTVKNNLTDIVTVATNISDVNAVCQNITDVETVADNLTDISAVADNITDVTTVASVSTAVSKVADNESNVNMVSDNMANVNTIASNMNSVLTVSGEISNVNTVAGNTTNINTVAGISSNVTTVAGIASDVTDVKNNATNINTVATNISNVNTAATNISSINAAASNMSAIIAAPTAATNAANSALNAATSATNAQKWAEGTDADVQPLGGTKSSKGWANRAQELVESIGTVMRYKGSVANYAALQAIQNPTLGDTYNVLDTGANYSWDGTAWDEIGSAVDLSAYRTSADQDLIDATKAPNTNKVNGIPLSTQNAYYYAESTSAADAVEKVVSIPAITELNAGQVIIVNPTVTSTVANSTLKLNSFNAYPMLYGGSNITTSTDSKVWSAYIPSIFVFDGSYWRFAGHGADDNTTYSINYMLYAGTANAGTGTYAVTRYGLLMQKPDGTWETLKETSTNYTTATTKTANTHGFLPGIITYYGTTAVKKNGEAIAVTSLYLKYSTVDARYSFNCGSTPGWSAGDNIYIVGTIGSDGLFYLDTTTWWSNALPTTKDGKVYMYLGTYSADAYKCSIDLDHPMYYHDGTSVKKYVVAGNKQDKLVSGTNIKTVNGTSLLGSGDVSITASAAWGSITGTLSDQTDLQNELDSKAPAVLLSHFWSDHIINEMSYLRGDTFSWQSGDVYTAAYEHITDDIITTIYDQDDYIVVGSPTINSGVISNFSSSNYVEYPSFTDDGKDVRMTIGFMLPTGYPNYAKPLTSFGNSGNNCSMFVVPAYKGGIEFRIKSGLSLSVQYALEEETLYVAELKRKNGKYTLKLYNPVVGLLGSTELTDATLIGNGDTSVIKYGHDGKVFGAEFPGSIYMYYTTVGHPTAQTETIGNYTITYYEADDGHKICLADQETTVYNLFNTTGNARYFILDTTNTRFKLPRWKHNKYQAKAPVIGTGIALGFTNGEVNFGTMAGGAGLDTYQGDYGKAIGTAYSGTRTTSGKVCGIVTDPIKSGIEATLEEDDMYLYFYVGTFTKTAYQETAGLNSELFNSKADSDGNNITFPHVIEAYDDGNGNGYLLYSNNYCEQYGFVSSSASNNTFVVNFLKPFADTNYNFIKDHSYSANGNVYQSQTNVSKATTSVTIYAADSHGTLPRLYQWRACGYIS